MASLVHGQEHTSKEGQHRNRSPNRKLDTGTDRRGFRRKVIRALYAGLWDVRLHISSVENLRRRGRFQRESRHARWNLEDRSVGPARNANPHLVRVAGLLVVEGKPLAHLGCT